MDIRNAKKRMFEQLSYELMNLVRIQFIITIVLFFVMMIILPLIGFGGTVMKIYPCLTVGYFILFVMYAAIIFLYYYHDLEGALITALGFAVATFAGAMISKEFTKIWYGIGLTVGAIVGWTIAYFRIRRIERVLDVHIFCRGHLMKRKDAVMPSNIVYDVRSPKQVMEDELRSRRRAGSRSRSYRGR